MNKPACLGITVLLCASALAIDISTRAVAAEDGHAVTPVDIRDPHLKRWHGLTYDRIPPLPSLALRRATPASTSTP